MRSAALLVAPGACGRLGFDPTEIDAAIDAPASAWIQRLWTVTVLSTT